jgi:hypothetical protein
MDKHYLTWQEFDVLCNVLQEKIKQHERELDLKFDCIIGLLRGGAIPAVWLAHNLNLPMRIIGLKSYDDTKQLDGVEFYNDIGKELDEFVDNRNVLIVDDICDSGRTISCITKYLEKSNKANKIRFATLHRAHDSYYVPDIYAIESTVWVVYPWEA